MKYILSFEERSGFGIEQVSKQSSVTQKMVRQQAGKLKTLSDTKNRKKRD